MQLHNISTEAFDYSVIPLFQGLPVTQTFGGYGAATFANLTLTIAANTSQVVYLTSFKNLLAGEVTLVGENLGALLFTA